MQCGVIAGGKTFEAFAAPGEILIGRGHIHISACEVALPLVGRLPPVAAPLAGAHTGAAVVACRGGLGHHAHGIVALGGIYLRLAGHEVVKVLIGIVLGSSPP